MVNFVNKNKRAAVIILLILAVNVITFADHVMNMNEYTARVRCGPEEIQSVDVTIEDENVAECTGYEQGQTGLVLVHFRTVGSGETDVRVSVNYEDERYWAETFTLRANRLFGLYRSSNLDFNRWHVFLIDAIVSLTLLSTLLFGSFVRRIKTDLYSYKTLQSGGCAIFVTAFSLLWLIMGIFVCLINGVASYMAFSVLSFSMYFFTLLVIGAMPFVFVFAVALSFSNIRLIQREGMRTVNLLGIALSLMLIAGTAVALAPWGYVRRMFSGAVSVVSAMQFTFTVIFAFLLSFILSTMICGLIAAKRVPEFDQDYIIILGCGIKKDGTLYPLIQGRVDRAIWFWKKQCETTGKAAKFIPSGGKGTDEIISESEAMKRYMVENGIPEEYIIIEDKSTTTLQNMRFSRAIIELETLNDNKPPKVIFSTTNYHVFRSGMLAGEAGLKANGIGGKTRWYFWPNAFVREFAGLLYSSRKLVLIFFGGMAIISFILGLIL